MKTNEPRSPQDRLGETIAIFMVLLTLLAVLPVRGVLILIAYVELYACVALEILLPRYFLEVGAPAFLLVIFAFAWVRSRRGLRNR